MAGAEIENAAAVMAAMAKALRVKGLCDIKAPEIRMAGC
jgi:hypothetical protein